MAEQFIKVYNADANIHDKIDSLIMDVLNYKRKVAGRI